MATASAPKIFKNFINGEWVEARGGKVLEDRSPANTDELVGVVCPNCRRPSPAIR